jgi:hypothetical protein
VQNHGAYLDFGNFRAHLISDSDPGNSTAWEGPMVITGAEGKSCSAEISIISPPFFMAGTHDLFATTYSGSENVLYLVDARNCNLVWSSDEFTGDPKLVGGNSFHFLDAKPVEISSDCTPVVK